MAQEKFERFGNYILLEKLASGGMAEIYLSKKLAAEGVQKFVAVKRILAEHSASVDFIRMFKDEAKIAVNLSHGNVVSIYDFGIENQQLFLVMEYMEGKNLRQILNRLKQMNKKFSISHIAYITKMIAAGLDHAHRLIDATTGQPLNIIHRDMSPQNVMISFEGEIKIIDFGIAKSTTQEENTRVGTLKGKFGYMSPEQVDGLEVDWRTDIFAMGIMLWEMLSEQRLFLTNNEMSTLRKIRDCKIPSLREIDPNIPVELEKIVNKGLARNKNQRYQTSAEMQKDLQSFLNRYNPDFSSQDFSEFIKDIYSDEILEARKRQVAYSKVDVPLDIPSAPTGKGKLDLFTQSMSFSKAQTDDVHFGNLELQAIESKPQGNTVDLNHSSNSNTSQAITTPMPPGKNGASTSHPQHQTNTHSTQAGINNPLLKDPNNKSPLTQSSIRIPQREDSSSSPIFGILIILIAGVIGIFAVINETQPKLVVRQCLSIKKLGVPITCYETGKASLASVDNLDVSSDPSGAEIYLNSINTKLKTPAKISVPKGKPFKIALSHPGFRQETLSFNDFPLSGKAHTKLTSVPSGTLVVSIVGVEAYWNDTKLYNGQRLSIEANKDIQILVKSPITGTSVMNTYSVKVNETKEVVLSLR